jgi:eukaryotic-like serine/threonine-protein kinase
MNPERWRRIEQVYSAAVERTPDEQAAYLAEACGEDQELRQEVESLLRNGERGWATGRFSPGRDVKS